MFTGIVTAVGEIVQVVPLGGSQGHGKRLAIAAPAGYLQGVRPGDSIALNGACMTVTRLDAAGSRFEIENYLKLHRWLNYSVIEPITNLLFSPKFSLSVTAAAEHYTGERVYDHVSNQDCCQQAAGMLHDLGNQRTARGAVFFECA